MGDRENPVIVNLEGREVPIAGQVDRLELDRKRDRLNIADFKTGFPVSSWTLQRQIREGSHLQLPLYALAVDTLARTDPGRVGLSEATNAPVGAMRLDFLKRQRPWKPGLKAQVKPCGIEANVRIGVDPEGRVLDPRGATAYFAAAFVDAIERGWFPLVHRLRTRFFKPRRDDELMRWIPDQTERAAGLPPPLEEPPPEDAEDGEEASA